MPQPGSESTAPKLDAQCPPRCRLGVFGDSTTANRNCWVYDIIYMAVCQNLVPLVNVKIAGKWMFIPLKMY
jgi:hypothetical protein